MNVRVFPNPFSEQVWVEFELSEATEVTEEVFDGLGRRVFEVVSPENMGAGLQHVAWDGVGLPAGLYLLRPKAGELQKITKLAKM